MIALSNNPVTYPQIIKLLLASLGERKTLMSVKFTAVRKGGRRHCLTGDSPSSGRLAGEVVQGSLHCDCVLGVRKEVGQRHGIHFWPHTHLHKDTTAEGVRHPNRVLPLPGTASHSLAATTR